MRANFPVHSARTLREEISATKDDSDRALLCLELARIHLALGDFASAAREAERASTLAEAFAEPLETSVTLAHLLGTPEVLPDLLGRLASTKGDPQWVVRSAFEFLAALLVGAEGASLSKEDISPLTRQLLEHGAQDPAVWLLVEIAGAAVGDADLRLQAALGRAGLAHGNEVRAALLERVAKELESRGRHEEALASLEQAFAEKDAPDLRKRLIRNSRSHQKFERALELTLEALTSAPDDEKRLGLTEASLFAVQAGDVSKARELLAALEALDPSDVFPPLFGAWLEKSDGDFTALLQAFERASSRATPDDQKTLALLSWLIRRRLDPSLGTSSTILDQASEIADTELRFGFRAGYILRYENDADALLSALVSELQAFVDRGPIGSEFLKFLETRSRYESGTQKTLSGKSRPPLDLDTLGETSLSRFLFEVFAPRLGALDAESPHQPKRIEDLRRAFSEARLPHATQALANLVLIDWELRDISSRPSALRRLETLLATDPSDALAAEALAGALAQIPLARADVLFTAARNATEPKLRSVWAIQAGLEYARAERNEIAVSALHLAEEAAPGCLGKGLLYLPQFETTGDESHSAQDGLTRLLTWTRSLPRRELEHLSEQLLFRDPEREVVSALLGALVAGAVADTERTGTWLGQLKLPPEEALLFEAGVALDAGQVDRAYERLSSLSELGTIDPRLITATRALAVRMGRDVTDAQSSVQSMASGSALGAAEAHPRAFFAEAQRVCENGPFSEALVALDRYLDEERSPSLEALALERSSALVVSAFQRLTLGLYGHDPNVCREALNLFSALEQQTKSTGAELARALLARELGLSETELEATLALASDLTLEPLERARFWQRAGYLAAEKLGHFEPAQRYFEQGLELDPTLNFAFAWLVEAAEKEGSTPRLLELTELRLGASANHSPNEVELLQFARGSYLRTLGRPGASLKALEPLRHSSAFRARALSLMGEMNLELDRKSQAADCLVELARITQLGEVERRAAAEHAAQLLEVLGRSKEAVALVLEAEALGSPEPKLRLLLVRAATAAGLYQEAFNALTRENDAQDEIPKRLHAARLMLAIQERHLRDPAAYADAARRVLRDDPLEADAQNAVLSLPFSREERRRLLTPALHAILPQVQENPLEGRRVRRFFELALAAGDSDTIRKAEGLAELLGAEAPSQGLAPPPNAYGVLGDEDLKLICPRSLLEADLVALRTIGSAVATLTEPDLESLGVSYLLRIDGAGDHALCAEVDPWARAFGIENLELYVGGSDPSACFILQRGTGVGVLGSALESPLTRRQCARLAAQLFALRQGFLALSALPDPDLELWLEAACAIPGSQGQATAGQATAGQATAPLMERVQALNELWGPDEKAIVERARAEWAARDMTAKSLRIALRMATLRSCVVAIGDASILRSLQDDLPDDDSRSTVLVDVLAFALSSGQTRLHRKVVGR